LATKHFAARLCSGESGLDPLTDEVTFEFGNAGEECRDHAAMWRKSNAIPFMAMIETFQLSSFPVRAVC